MTTALCYRPEIDGLRCIAVFGVIAYHANFIYLDTNLVSGGFIGVDIFFVISGYLIARILLSDIAENQFSYIWFYEKRARRLLPLLLCVITVCIPFAWAIYLPSQMVDFSTQILTVLTFSSNVYYWFDGSYWTAEAISQPFLHTWPLAIEEQFYLLMPLSLFWGTKLAPARLIYYLILLMICSLVLAQIASIKNPETAFYLLPFRGWELLAGVYLALVKKRVYGRWTDYLPTIGFVMIISSFF